MIQKPCRIPAATLFGAVLGAGLILCASAQPAGGAVKPNILFCIADDASHAHFGAYGCGWVKTPAFDRVAAEGLLFRNAYTPNAKCAPSRACILTGRNSWQLEEAANHWCYFPKKFTTYAEALGEKGYHVGYTGKPWAPGVVGKRDGKPRQLVGKGYGKRTAKPPTRGISGNDYAANFRDFLVDRKAGQPFCFWYGCYEPHRGYEYGSGIAKGGRTVRDVDHVPGIWPDNDTVRTDMLDYGFEIEHFDRHLGRMLVILEELGELDNTLVVVTSDNGMPFPRIKGQEYEYSNHMPLAMMWKNGLKKPGRVVEDYVSFIDLAPTFLEVAGLDGTGQGMQPRAGRSLVPLLESVASGRVDRSRDHVLIGKERHDIGRPHDGGYPIRGIVQDGYLYVRNFETDRWPAGDPETGYLNTDGSPTKTQVLDSRMYEATRHYWTRCFGKRPAEELYHVAADPACMKNLAGDLAQAQRKAQLKKLMTAELKAQGDPRMSGQGRRFDEYPYADKKCSDFHERYRRGEKVPSGWVTPTDFEPRFPKRTPIYREDQILPPRGET